MGVFGISYGISPALHLLLIAALSSLAACTVQKKHDFQQTAHDITLQDANELIKRYKDNNSSAESDVIFSKDSLERVFPPSNTNLSGIRYYFGLDNSKMVIIVLGTENTGGTNDDVLTSPIIVSPNSTTISEDSASQLTKAYQATINDNDYRGGFFSADAIRAVLYDYGDQSKCTGLRFSYGKNTDNQLTLVVRGVDNTNTDIANGRIIDMSVPCPPDCGKRNIINNYP